MSECFLTPWLPSRMRSGSVWRSGIWDDVGHQDLMGQEAPGSVLKQRCTSGDGSMVTREALRHAEAGLQKVHGPPSPMPVSREWPQNRV